MYFDAKKEFRVRIGQSKIPFSYENMQSSQNRIALDRNDALNTCCRDERDVGAFFYYTPENLRHVFRDLVTKNLKGSGDYGVFALGVYNGQGANRVELNENVHVVSRVTYPYTFANGQIVEAGVQGLTGRFVPGTASIVTNRPAPSTASAPNGFRDSRVGVHATSTLNPSVFRPNGTGVSDLASTSRRPRSRREACKGGTSRPSTNTTTRTSARGPISHS